ncbi:hypothetical protein FACS189450_04340 [Spirochaetia bacterium]|nr:hypothetical protein FACS189450_04340 [Spirochaetia bacterium]
MWETSPNPFHLEGVQRINLRENIFREVIINMLIHIARFFRQIGRAEELGSGVRKIYKYCKAYSGYDPVITDDNDCFRFILQVDFFKSDTKDSSITPKISDQVSDQDVGRDERILSFCETPKSADEIQKHIGITHKTYFRKTILNPLIESGRLARTSPDKPTSKSQKYVTVGRK